MTMEFRAPDRIECWTGKINDIADVRMFYYHLLLDMGIWSFLISPIHKTIISDNKSIFSGRDVINYNKLLNDCFEICGNVEFTLTGIWSELGKWISDDNYNRSNRMYVINDSTGKVIYEARYRSDFPHMSILFPVDYFNNNKKNKKIGYGTIKYLAKPDETEQFYAVYDNESKKYFDGILYKLNNGSYRINVAGK